MKINYKIKEDFQVEGKGVHGFVVQLRDDKRPDPERFDKLYAKLLSMGYAPFPVEKDRRTTCIALGVALDRTKEGKILWTETDDYNKNQWLNFNYETFMSRKIKVVIT